MIHDTPVAVLIGRNGYERVLPLSSANPPERLAIANRQSWNLSEPTEPSAMRLISRRTFRLSRGVTSRDHQWWHVYNEGRSKTPENGFVYFEEGE